VLTGLELDETDSVRVLDGATWTQLRDRLEQPLLNPGAEARRDD
jgi:hypothetical protein